MQDSEIYYQQTWFVESVIDPGIVSPIMSNFFDVMDSSFNMYAKLSTMIPLLWYFCPKKVTYANKFSILYPQLAITAVVSRVL